MEERDETRRLMELQMDALKEEHGVDVNAAHRIPKNARSANNAKIAKLYEDAAEYEAELKMFESEMVVVEESPLVELVERLQENNPAYEGDYAKEISQVILNGFTQLVEAGELQAEALERVKGATFAEYATVYEAQIREILLKRWSFLVEMKKEHIADERAELKLRGMKPDHVRKVYYNYHGLPQE